MQSQKFFHNGMTDKRGRSRRKVGKKLDGFLHGHYRSIISAGRQQILDRFQELMHIRFPQSLENVGGASLRSTSGNSRSESVRSSPFPADSTVGSATIAISGSHTFYLAPKVIPRYDGKHRKHSNLSARLRVLTEPNTETYATRSWKDERDREGCCLRK